MVQRAVVVRFGEAGGAPFPIPSGVQQHGAGGRDRPVSGLPFEQVGNGHGVVCVLRRLRSDVEFDCGQEEVARVEFVCGRLACVEMRRGAPMSARVLAAGELLKVVAVFVAMAVNPGSGSPGYTVVRLGVNVCDRLITVRPDNAVRLFDAVLPLAAVLLRDSGVLSDTDVLSPICVGWRIPSGRRPDGIDGHPTGGRVPRG